MSAKNQFRLTDLLPLVVDDNPQALDVITSILVGFGIKQSIKCQSADEAIEQSNNREFDLLIVDCEMPERDGYEVVKTVRGNVKGVNFSVPILMMSATTPQHKVERARDTGANFMIAKPLSPAVVLEKILWIARSSREFIIHENYRGPDRRFHTVPLTDGMVEKRESILRVEAAPSRVLSQNEIDGLF